MGVVDSDCVVNAADLGGATDLSGTVGLHVVNRCAVSVGVVSAGVDGVCADSITGGRVSQILVVLQLKWCCCELWCCQ